MTCGLCEEDVLPDEIKWIGSTNPKLEALYRDVAEVERPVIIITRFTAEAARIFDDLSKQYHCCLMTGWKRVGTIEEFQQGKYDVMVANSSVVARGFNLQNSHTILFYTNTFSLETRLQSEGRIFRIGQTHPCDYIDYTYEDTVDEKIVGALSMKRNLLDYIRGVENVKELV
jgi:SNF2 family DNA or RNA helicase